VRKLRVQEQKFRDAQGPNLRGMGFAVGFDGNTTAQKADPLQIFGTLDRTLETVGYAVKVSFEKGSEGIGPLHIATQLDELPTFAVAHGRVSDAVKKISAFEDRQEEVVGPENPTLVGTPFDDVEIKAIELFPHAAAALFANVAKIFAPGSDARNNRGTVGAAEDDSVQELRRIDRARNGGCAKSIQ
jgi:hypothetical protein